MNAGDRVSMMANEGNMVERLETAEANIRELKDEVMRLLQLDHATVDLGDQGMTSIAGTAVVQDEDGITFPQNGDGIQFVMDARIASMSNVSGKKGLTLERFNLGAATRLETNGDFETGDLSGWTLSGTVTPVISTEEAHGGIYSCKLVGGAGIATIYQTMTLSASNKAAYLRFRRECSAPVMVVFAYLDAGGATLAYKEIYFEATNGSDFALGTVGMRPTVVSGTIAKVKVAIGLYSTSGSDYAFIDDVEVYEGNDYVEIALGDDVSIDGGLTLKDGDKIIAAFSAAGLLMYDGMPITADDVIANTMATNKATIVTTSTYTVAETDSAIICNYAGTVTLTLPSATTYPGRWLAIKTVTANTVISASSNVRPLNSQTLGTAILAAAAGKWAYLQAYGGGVWHIMMGA